MNLEIRRGTAADIDAAAAVLAAAFADSPWTGWTVDACDHTERIAALQRLVMERAVLPFGEIWVAIAGRMVVGVALWMDPRHAPHPEVWAGMRDETVALEGDRHHASAAAELALAHMKPGEPHFFLGAVGVQPDQQRRGIGARLLAPTLARADEQAIGAYLETSTASNVAFYERLGFTVTGECVIPDGGPPVWAMTRRPGESTPGTSASR